LALRARQAAIGFVGGVQRGLRRARKRQAA
jgi:hypothetical protein